MTPIPADPNPVVLPPSGPPADGAATPPRMCGNLPYGGPIDLEAVRRGGAPLPADPAAGPDAEERGAGMLPWPANKRVINVSFMQNDSHPFIRHLRDQVRALVLEWSAHANLDFQFFEWTTGADICINFAGPQRNVNSRIGRSSWDVAKDGQASMNLVFPQHESATSIRSVILHEFGHALGLVHEHQMPADHNPIVWDRQNIYHLYAAAFNLQNDQALHNYINTQMLDRPATSAAFTHLQRFDTNSIMLYPIPRGCAWVNGQEFVVDPISELSDGDKSIIANMYSGRPRPGQNGGGNGGGGNGGNGGNGGGGTHPPAELVIGEEIEDWLDGAGLARTYHFALPAGGWLHFRTAGDGEKQVRVYGPDSPSTEYYNLLAQGDGNVNTKRGFDPGTYDVKVSMPVGTGPYRLKVSAATA